MYVNIWRPIVYFLFSVCRQILSGCLVTNRHSPWTRHSSLHRPTIVLGSHNFVQYRIGYWIYDYVTFLLSYIYMYGTYSHGINVSYSFTVFLKFELKLTTWLNVPGSLYRILCATEHLSNPSLGAYVIQTFYFARKDMMKQKQKRASQS